MLLFCSVGMIAVLTSPAFAQTCKVTSINVSGAVSTSANGVNSYDTVVGSYVTGPPYYNHAFKWSQGTITKYNYPGAIATEYSSNNDHGVIVGTEFSPGGVGHGMVRTTSGQSTVFRYPNSYSTFAIGINNYGAIVGAYQRAQSGRWYGFLKTSGGYATLNFPNSTSTWANSISDTNEIGGRYLDAGGAAHGFTYKNGTYTRVDFQSSTGGTSVNGVNKYGSLVGSYQVAKDIPVSAWQRKGGVFTSVTWNNDNSISLNGINNLGDEVGSAGLSSSRPGFLRICR